MMVKGMKWCPNGCGKCVWYIRLPNTKNSKGRNCMYECRRCNVQFKKEDMKL